MVLTQKQEEVTMGRAKPLRFNARRKASIILIYSAIGPFIGGIVATALIIALLFHSGPFGLADDFRADPFEFVFTVPVLLAIGSIYGYFFGIGQALLCGFLLAAISNHEGRFSYKRAAFAALITMIISFGVITQLLYYDLVVAFVLVAAALPSSLLLRFFFRKRFAPVKASL